MTLLTRRSLLRGLFAAPAIVAVGNIMPVKMWKPEPEWWWLGNRAINAPGLQAYLAMDDIYDPRFLAMDHDIASFHATLRLLRSL